ncbi:MAG: hypothetical protein QM756_16835 [Polyangiaceae bacterium]
MQVNSDTEAGFARYAEESILAELRNKQSVAEAALKSRVRDSVRGFNVKDYKAVLDGLVAARKIYGRPKLSKTGKPTKAVESYVFGEPPPVPTPKQAVLEALGSGALPVASLKAKVVASVPGLSAKDYNAALAALIDSREIHAHLKISAKGKPTKTAERYELGAAPPPEPGPFVSAVLAAWRKARDEGEKAGLSESALLGALLQGLGVSGAQASNQPVTRTEARQRVMNGVRELLRREGVGALIPIRKLRAVVSLAKPEFDAAVFELRDDESVILHHHEYVGSLSEAERAELVLDRYGNYFMGVALRGES